jgi:omega-amidase
MSILNVAAVQLDIQWEDRRATHQRICQLLDKSDLPSNTLIVLPEMFDVGFTMHLPIADPGDPSCSDVFLRKLAAEKNGAVLAGSVARATGGKLANEAVAFSPQGVELVRYRKMQPFTPPGEHIHYPAGNKQATFRWEGAQISPFVCYDLRFPELFRPAARAGAELIVVVANWPNKRSEHWVRLLQARAIENQAFVLGVNRCGTDPSFTYDGRSALFDPMGNEIFQADAREQVLLAKIDLEEARTWRDQFPALRDMRL